MRVAVVLGVYVRTNERYFSFELLFSAVCAGSRVAAAADSTSRNANTRRAIFMRGMILSLVPRKRSNGKELLLSAPSYAQLLLFFFVFFPEDGGGGDGVVGIEPQQAHALRGAASLANFIRVHANHFAVVGDDHHVGF